MNDDELRATLEPLMHGFDPFIENGWRFYLAMMHPATGTLLTTSSEDAYIDIDNEPTVSITDEPHPSLARMQTALSLFVTWARHNPHIDANDESVTRAFMAYVKTTGQTN